MDDLQSLHNLNKLWDRAVRLFADRTAVIFEGQPTSYRELDAMIRAFAAGLADLGVQPGDRVALVMPNCLHSIICYLGAIRAGAIALPINIRLRPQEMQFILQDAAPTAVVAHQSLRAEVVEALAGVETVRHRLGLGFEGEGFRDVAEMTPGSSGSRGSG
ncbi:AMP-binding protein, partial [bacterium]|nr:AMP-binding protein [bacterium]